jgi:hypothetical protein
LPVPHLVARPEDIWVIGADKWRNPGPMALLLGDLLPGVEQMEPDFPGDGVTPGLRAGEVVGLLGLPGAGAVRRVADEESGHEDLQQEHGEGEV